MTHLHISVTAITRGTLARTHELKRKLIRRWTKRTEVHSLNIKNGGCTLTTILQLNARLNFTFVNAEINPLLSHVERKKSKTAVMWRVR